MTKTETMSEWELFISPRLIAAGLVFLGLVLFLTSDYLTSPGESFKAVRLGLLAQVAALTTWLLAGWWLKVARRFLMMAMLLIVLVGVLSLSSEILDAARVDGASEYQVFLQVVLPLVRPAIGTLFILFSLEGWNDLLWPLIVMRSDEKFTLAVGIQGLVGLYRPRWDLVMAASFLATFPIVVLFLFMQKQFIAGISSLGSGVEK